MLQCASASANACVCFTYIACSFLFVDVCTKLKWFEEKIRNDFEHWMPKNRIDERTTDGMGALMFKCTSTVLAK